MLFLVELPGRLDVMAVEQLQMGNVGHERRYYRRVEGLGIYSNKF
jgi:hypothetical protein